MEEETGMRESSVLLESTDTDKPGDPNTEESRSGPGWKGWVLSILAAIILSVTATLLLGGSGAGSSCCPTANAGK